MGEREKMDDWHNGTVQGQRNTVAARKLKHRAASEMTKWRKANKAEIEKAGGIPSLPVKFNDRNRK